MKQSVVCCVTLAMAFSALAPRTASAQRVEVPPVPGTIQVPAGNRAFLLGHAVGTQNYLCLPSTSGFSWTLVGPQATLFNEDDEQLTTHFLSPNPRESGLARATWQHSRDTSSVWARAIATSSDPDFVAPGAIPWLLLQVVGAAKGPDGGDRLTAATYLHRVNTVGGMAPSTGCAVSTDVGARAFAPYLADYIFYKRTGR